jgi:hypothetical protein
VYPTAEFLLKAYKLCTSRYGLELVWIEDSWKIEIHLLIALLCTYAMLAIAKSLDHIYLCTNAFPQNQLYSLLLSKMHNPCLLYWISHAEYN